MLPRQIRFIAGESNGSYVSRLAHENGMDAHELWAVIGDGGQIFEPRHSDGYLNAAALTRLAAVTGRAADVLAWPLPNLRPHRLLDGGAGPEWKWPWDLADGFLVRCCELCARIKGTPDTAFLVSRTPWTVCTRHGRYLDNRREDGASSIALRAVPEVVDAHRRRTLLERRFAEAGRLLFADAYAVASCWWNLPSLCPPVWQARQRLLGAAGRDELRVAPLVFYPEAVTITEAMARRELLRRPGSWDAQHERHWLSTVDGLLKSWRMPVDAVEPLVLWAHLHQGRSRPGGVPSEGSVSKRRRSPAVPALHAPLPSDAGLTELSCLPWELGELLDPDTVPAVDGWALLGRA